MKKKSVEDDKRPGGAQSIEGTGQPGDMGRTLRPDPRRAPYEKLSTERFEEAERQLRKLFGKNVREARQRVQMTQAEVGTIIGNHQTYVAKIERGEQNVTLEVVTRIAYAVRTDPGALLLGEAPENYSLETLIRIVGALHRHLQNIYEKVGNTGFECDLVASIPRPAPTTLTAKHFGRSQKKST